MTDHPTDNPFSCLTERERQIVRLVVSGLSNREMTEKFKIGEHVVKHSLCGIYDKLGVSNRAELALLAINHPGPAIGYWCPKAGELLAEPCGHWHGAPPEHEA